MSGPEKNMLNICLLKADFDEMENGVVQRMSCPDWDSETEQKFRELLNELRASRLLCEEKEQLKQENARLLARRLQLKHQCESLNKALEEACESYRELQNKLQREQQDIDQLVRNYEDSLRLKSERNRNAARFYYDKEKVEAEIKQINNTNALVEEEMRTRQRCVVAELRRQLAALQPAVPGDLLEILGKKELDEKVKSLTDECEALKLKRNKLLNKRNNSTKTRQ